MEILNYRITYLGVSNKYKGLITQDFVPAEVECNFGQSTPAINSATNLLRAILKNHVSSIAFGEVKEKPISDQDILLKYEFIQDQVANIPIYWRAKDMKDITFRCEKHIGAAEECEIVESKELIASQDSFAPIFNQTFQIAFLHANSGVAFSANLVQGAGKTHTKFSPVCHVSSFIDPEGAQKLHFTIRAAKRGDDMLGLDMLAEACTITLINLDKTDENEQASSGKKEISQMNYLLGNTSHLIRTLANSITQYQSRSSKGKRKE